VLVPIVIFMATARATACTYEMSKTESYFSAICREYWREKGFFQERPSLAGSSVNDLYSIN